MKSIEVEGLTEITHLSSGLSKKGRFATEEFLHFAIAAVAALENVHRYHVIHKDFNTFNLLYDEKERICWVVDFGLSIPIDHQKVIPIDPRFLEGTVAYLSPEQSGRMNRGIDYRTDYYSLGVTLYQAITGELPFFSKPPSPTSWRASFFTITAIWEPQSFTSTRLFTSTRSGGRRRRARGCAPSLQDYLQSRGWRRSGNRRKPWERR